MTPSPHSELVARARHYADRKDHISPEASRVILAAFTELEEQFEALLKVAEGLFQMIDRETWRATGGDDQQGHYEGDYRAAQIEEYLVGLRGSNPASTPDDQKGGTDA